MLRTLAFVLFAALMLIAPARAQMLGADVSKPVTPTIQAVAYSSGQAVGALQTVGVFRSDANASGLYNSLVLLWNGTETTPLTFFVFDANPTASTCNDNASFVLAAADKNKLVMPPVTLTAAAPTVGTTATQAQSSFTAFSVNNKDSPTTNKMYVCAVAGGSFTPAVGDLTYKLSVLQD